MKRSKHITLDDLPPKYREQAERQLKGDGDAKDAVEYMHEIDGVLSKAPPGSIVYAHPELKRLMDAQRVLKATGPSRKVQHFKFMKIQPRSGAE